MPTFVGFGVKNYRSFFGEQAQLVGPLQKVNLLAGQNNTGKSNILRVAQQLLNPCSGQTGSVVVGGLGPADRPVAGRDELEMELLIAVKPHDGEETIFPQAGFTAHSLGAMKAAFSDDAFKLSGHDDATVWFRYKLTQTLPAGDATLDISHDQLTTVMASMDQYTRQGLAVASSEATNVAGGILTADLNRIVQKLGIMQLVPKVRTIEAFRQIKQDADSGNGMDVSESVAGNGVILHLARLQDPDYTGIDDRKKFDAINDFVQYVLDDPTARISVPHTRRTIHIHHHGRELPLENIGSGIHQVVILAAAATMFEDCLLCIEEPEIHLHPLLQRKLLNFLATNTSNRYLIATHSAHMLDAEVGSIFHLTLSDDAGTNIEYVTSPHGQAAVCSDLGYRPSDLVQANAIIWVEGPSDRLYLRRWIELIDSTLQEGIHYSVMFYGGRLLNHLSGDDPAIYDDFISLRRLNRHIAIVIDSDKTSGGQRINATKRRVRETFDRGPGFSWVTYGYTIENYVPPALLNGAISAVYPRAKLLWDGQRYQNPLSSDVIEHGPIKFDKLAVARRVVEGWTGEAAWIGDLQKRVRQTVDFIREANGRPPMDWRSSSHH